MAGLHFGEPVIASLLLNTEQGDKGVDLFFDRVEPNEGIEVGAHVVWRADGPIAVAAKVCRLIGYSSLDIADQLADAFFGLLDTAAELAWST
jgi:hypothetical protein